MNNRLYQSAKIARRTFHRPGTVRLVPPGLAGLLAAVCLGLPAGAAVHPLEPLSTNELRTAVEVLLREGLISTNTVLPMLALREPAKEVVIAWKPGMPWVREAAVTTYDLGSHRTHEAIVNLDQKRVSEWRLRPGVDPLQTASELAASNQLLHSNATWIAALKRRGLTNLALVDSTAIASGLIPHRGADHVRLLRSSPFHRQTNRMTWEPIEGLSAVVDMTHGKVIEIIDREIIPRSKSSMDFLDPAVRGSRERLKPLVVTQPEGASFTVRDHAVSWDRWRFRYSMHPRDGLVLHQVGWEDGGRVRSVLYRGSISDLLVPYGDPDPAWSWRAFFDESDFGLGYNATPLVRGINSPAYATLLSEPMPDPSGNGNVLVASNLVDLYERDVGSLWSHYDLESRQTVGPRARELVIGWMSTVGNYDYRFQWSFRQDGSLEFHVYLTGVMQLKGTHATLCAGCATAGQNGKSQTVPGQPHGVLVADHLIAPHHQHLFNARLDFDVDGRSNSVKEFSLKTDRRSRSNPHGNGFSLVQTVFARERQAARDLHPASHRMWAVVNPSSVSALGHPAGYLLEPGMNTVPFLSLNSPARRRAGFTEHHFFATRYRVTEMYAGGDYPVAAAPPDNVLTWSRDNERIQNEDVVVWYTFGLTHVARPEEFPVMPSAHTGFRLVPKAFFARNPALEIPDTPAP